ncbi:SurA N-terminal domain-containing protein [Spiribacter insolitus]|uniref:Periplasmic chaperone PpiD n=1 Tax=Spiribacter insolitus TaxID=3122417 RepID=A0ABV3T9F7_9GAMM
MLLAIRDRTRGWIAYLIVALLVIPFALFGLYNYVGGGGPQIVATVNGEEITRSQLDQAYQQRQAELRQMLGERFDPSLFDTDQLRRQTLQQLIDRQVLVDYAQTNGLQASNADVASSVRSQSIFQVDGSFSMDRYRTILQQNGLTPEAYEAQLRRDLSITLLQRAVETSSFTTDRALDRLLELQGQRRELAWATVPTAAYQDEVEVTGSALQTWYDEHPDRFQLPEQVQLRYLRLSPEGIAEDVTVSASDVEARYEERSASTRNASAREVRHILVNVPDGADETAVETALEEIESARERIQGGETFAAVAESVSDDPGSAAQGGSLGTIERGDVDAAFADAAWSLTPGELSEPVRTSFGWHLIEVTDAPAPEMPPLEQMRDQIREEIALERAERRVIELANELDTLAFENPTTLEPAAQATGVEVETTDWISASGTENGLASETGVVQTAFSDEMLERRENSDLLELSDGGYAVIRVTDYRPARVEPFETVREEVQAAYVREQARASARNAAQSIADAVEAGESLEAAAADVPAAELNPAQWSGRNARALPAGVRETGFRLPMGDGTGQRAGVATLPEGFAAVTVQSVEPGDPTSVDAERRAQLRRTLNELDGQASVNAIVEALRSQAEVRIREDNI